MEVKFHCESVYNSQNATSPVSAFLYTDYTIEPHNHDFYEMNIIMRGKGTHKIDDVTIDVKVGDVFVIPPMTVHAYCNTENLDVYHVLLRKDFIAENREEAASIPGYLQLVEIEPYLRRHSFKDLFLHLSGSQLMQIKLDLSVIEDTGAYNKKELLSLIKNTVWKILYMLSTFLYNQTHSENNDIIEKNDYAVVRALEYIHCHYGEKITIENLCKITFLSRSTFLRCFNSMCGCTPSKYLNDYRCKKAEFLLKSTKYSKTAVAHLCGFYDLSHMERALKNEIKRQ